MLKMHRSRSARALTRAAVVTALVSCSWAMTGLTATAGSAQARLAEGTYRITNVASSSTMRTYYAGGEAFVSSTRENPGPFELWQITNSRDGSYTIENVGINIINMLDSYAAVRQTAAEEPVVTSRDATDWSIEPAGNGTYVIKVPGQDLLWNAEAPVVPRGDVKLRAADGSDAQRWSLVLAD
ncbi:RICIN domain-containing protein [Nonomuraea insulae]|uniref:Ricin B lectin domain-containing protein n=1 Tax=Nonomuraea insulae TaxID=1616787 RepID=A0ABW1CTU7_9ACTN